MGWLTHDQYERLNTAGIRTYFEEAMHDTLYVRGEVYMVLSRPEFPNAVVCLIINDMDVWAELLQRAKETHTD